MSQTASTEQFQAQMQEAIARAEDALARGARLFEDQGLNSDKALAFFAAQFNEQSSKEAKAAFEADMEAVGQEVREEMAQLAHTSGQASASLRRPRPMV